MISKTLQRLAPAALCLFLAAAPLAAQGLPDRAQTPPGPWITDSAQLLTAEEAEILSDRLAAAEQETGAEIALLTQASRPGGNLAAWTARVFDAWALNEAEHGNAILIVVLSGNREMRIQLGSAYGHGWDGVAQNIVEEDFLPAFADGDFASGLIDGTEAVVDLIARPLAAGEDPQDPRRLVPAMLFMIFAGVVGTVAWRRRGHARGGSPKASPAASKPVKACPQCGDTAHLQHRTQVRMAPAPRKTGQGLRQSRCTACGWHRSVPFIIPALREQRDGRGDEGDGGGNGGGASGRW